MKRIYNGVTVEYQNETDYNQSNVVYLITFPDGKYYVGSTMRKLYNRLSLHCTASIIQSKSFLISHAIREFMKFSVKVLDNELDKNKLRKLEEYYTIEYKSNEIEFGYNFGCGCVRKFSNETKLKISESHKGKVFSDETKLKISESHKGKVFSDETKLKISESRKGKVFSDEHKLKISESKGQPFFDDFNNQFRSTYHASEFYKCCQTTIRMLLKSGKQSKKLGTGFHY